MRKQFFRFYIGIGLVLVATAMILPFFLRRQLDTAVSHHREQLLKPLVAALRFRTEQTANPQQAVDDLLRELGRGFPVSLRLVSADETALSPDARKRLSEGELVTRDAGSGPGRDAYANIGGGVIARVALSPPRLPPLGEPFTSIVLLTLILTGAAVFFLLRPIERRILDLAKVAKRFGTGDFSSRADVGQMGAVDQLESNFNWMADRIEQLLMRQRELLRDVSHDLRTPLSRLFFALDAALGASSPEEKDQHLQRIDRGLTQLDDLVKGLLTYQRLSDSVAPLKREHVALGPLLKSLAEMVADLRSDLTLEAICSEEKVFAEPRLFLSALSNLVTNAVSFSRRRIRFTCQAEPEGTLLNVEDDGPGIPEAAREQIFEPFYCIDGSRTDPYGGLGLGLAIVSKIMERHGGRVSVGVSKLGGAAFSLYFPSGDLSAPS